MHFINFISISQIGCRSENNLLSPSLSRSFSFCILSLPSKLGPSPVLFRCIVQHRQKDRHTPDGPLIICHIQHGTHIFCIKFRCVNVAISSRGIIVHVMMIKNMYIYIHIKIDSDFTENLSMMVHPNLQSPHSGVVNSGGISPSTRSDDVGVGHPMIKGFGALSSKTFGRHPNPGRPLDCIATTSHNLQPRIYHRNETLNTLRQSMRVTLQSTPALFIFQDLLVAHI